MTHQDHLLRVRKATTEDRPLSQYPAIIELSSLDGTNGFKLSGVKIGRSVASAGDMNGDGFDDMIVGASAAGGHGYNVSTGESYVLFGHASGFAADLDLSSLNGVSGFRLTGTLNERSGYSVASAGDVDGDGFADVIVGAPGADHTNAFSGAAYVVFGKESGFGANLDLSSLNGTNGFKLSGVTVRYGSKISVASAGDVNGDGFDDMIIGSRFADRYTSDLGASYVVFGKGSGFAADIDLQSPDGSDGFRLSGAEMGDRIGVSVASAGDINGDGFDDMIVGTHYADPHGEFSGASYVIFGKTSGFAANISLSNLNGSNGFRLSGVAPGDDTGMTVASAGDVNGDGLADLIVGAPRANPNRNNSGASYVVFGRSSGFAANLELSTLDGGNGFKLSGDQGERSGTSVAAAGDVNGDGIDDLIVGAPVADTNDKSSGATYVVFGKASGFAANVNLSTLDGTNGFKLSGVARGDKSGYAVASAGDVNFDGFADLFVGSWLHGSYVVFGQAPDAAVDRTGTAASQTLAGGAFNDTLSGLGGNDRLHGNAGNDELNGGSGADVMIGGDGDDTYIVDNALDVVVEAGTGYDRLSTSVSVALTADHAIEFLSGRGTAGLTLTGNQLNNSVWGSAGNDTLAGGAGNDILRGKDGNDNLLGGAGADIMDGGAGDDTYIVDDASDVVVETGTGYDRLSTSVSVTLTAVQSIEFLDGRGTAGLMLAGNQLANSVWGSAGNDTVAGAGGDDSLRGKGGNDTLFGGKGNDTLEGGDGADLFRYRLGDGNDQFTDFSGAGGDRVALVNGTVSQLVNNIATLSDGSVLTAQTGYAWAASDFMPA